MTSEEPKIEKPEPMKEITPTPEIKEEKFDMGESEKRVEEHQKTRQELEKEGQEKDLQLFREFKEKENLSLTKPHLKK